MSWLPTWKDSRIADSTPTESWPICRLCPLEPSTLTACEPQFPSLKWERVPACRLPSIELWGIKAFESHCVGKGCPPGSGLGGLWLLYPWEPGASYWPPCTGEFLGWDFLLLPTPPLRVCRAGWATQLARAWACSWVPRRLRGEPALHSPPPPTTPALAASVSMSVAWG